MGNTETYGWLDGGRTQPAPIDAMICTATASRFHFACAWTDYLRAKGLNRNAPFLQVCNALPNVERFGPVADDRIAQVSVHHMLTERTGWKGASVAKQARKRMGLSAESPQDFLQILWTQRLDANPGSQAAAQHSAFHGWCEIVGLDAMTGKPGIEAIRQYSLKPLGVDSVEFVARNELKWLYPRPDYEHDPRLVHNARGTTVSSASSYALALLMATHYADGRIRDRQHAGLYYAFGQLPQSTCTLVWAGNTSWAIILNRGAPQGNRMKYEQTESNVERLVW